MSSAHSLGMSAKPLDRGTEPLVGSVSEHRGEERTEQATIAPIEFVNVDRFRVAGEGWVGRDALVIVHVEQPAHGAKQLSLAVPWRGCGHPSGSAKLAPAAVVGVDVVEL